MAIDGEPATVGTPADVAPGPHTIALRSPCGEVTRDVEVAAGERVMLGREAFADLRLAQLRVRATSTDGKPLEIEVRLANASGADVWSTRGEEAWVPACPLRMTITSEGLGAFVEDVAFEPGESVALERVLAPGPDVVRIAGGTFVSGPPAAARREQHAEDENVERTVATFDLDRTEVTVAQYEACMDAGACVETIDALLKLEHPRPPFDAECNSVHRSVDHRTVARTTTPGREAHPIDCVSMWEAERYCAWAGKRLPSSVEWEFAARSRKTEYAWPWGNDETTCRVHASGWVGGSDLCPQRSGTVEPCAYPEGNSEQGVCDLVGNVWELVEFPAGDPRRGGFNNRGAGYDAVVEVSYLGAERLATVDLERARAERFVQHVGFGFRCARDVRESKR